ncbi:MAG: 2-dehydropantoate 2-reductase [Saprospiraceae bacterium]
MEKKTKILVAGIGGIGGFFGGLLAKKYHDDASIDIYFLARGEHLAAIQAHGLKVEYGTDSFLAHPTLATDDPKQIGVVDYILLCSKSYDIDELASQLAPCIDNNTVILPAQNGVDAYPRIANLYPNSLVLQGCAYIIASIKAPGIVQNTGNIQKLFFGSNKVQDPHCLALEEILQSAGIDAHSSDDIKSIVWEKFAFISPLATATTYFNMNIGEVLLNHKPELLQLISEIVQIAKAQHISQAEDLEKSTLDKILKMPASASSSMHRDFYSGKGKSEIDSLTKYVVDKGLELGIETPTFERMYKELKSRFAQMI